MDLPASRLVDVVGLDELAAQLVKLAPERVGYLSIERCLPRNGAEPLGRRNYTRTDLHAFVDDDAPEPPGWADEPEPPSPTAAPADEDAERVVLVRAVCRWIVELAEEQSAGDGEFKLKVTAWAPKGSQNLYSKRLAVVVRQTDQADREEPSPTAAPIGLPVEEDDKVESGTWSEMNRAVRSLLRTTLGTFQTVLEAQADASRQTRITHASEVRLMREANAATTEHLRQVIRQQSEQLRDAFGRIDELIGETLGFKIDVAELGIGQTRSLEDRRVSADLQKQFVDQAGSLAQLWLASKTGVLFDPELLELMKVVQADDALRTALKSPKVLAMLKSAVARPVVISTLVDAAEAFAKMADAGGSSPPPEPENTP